MYVSVDGQVGIAKCRLPLVAVVGAAAEPQWRVSGAVGKADKVNEVQLEGETCLGTSSTS